MRDQVDVVLASPNRFHRRADGHRSLQPDRDRSQKPVVRPGEPVADAFVALLREVALILGRLQMLTGLLDEADELRLTQLRAFDSNSLF